MLCFTQWVILQERFEKFSVFIFYIRILICDSEWPFEPFSVLMRRRNPFILSFQVVQGIGQNGYMLCGNLVSVNLRTHAAFQ